MTIDLTDISPLTHSDISSDIGQESPGLEQT